MKTRLSIAVLLTVIGVLLVVGVTGARQSNPGYTVYLPIVAKPPCSPKVTAYVSASKPVVRVVEFVTLTGAIVNECAALVGLPEFYALTEPQGILSPTALADIGYYSVPIGAYRELTLTLLAVGSGPAAVTATIYFEALNDYTPPMFYWDFVQSDPIVVRVLPSP